MTDMHPNGPVPQFKSRKDYDQWWMKHSIAINRLAVTDPKEFGRIATEIEKQLAQLPA
jgi:hypothetical protein